MKTKEIWARTAVPVDNEAGSFRMQVRAITSRWRLLSLFCSAGCNNKKLGERCSVYASACTDINSLRINVSVHHYTLRSVNRVVQSNTTIICFLVVAETRCPAYSQFLSDHALYYFWFARSVVLFICIFMLHLSAQKAKKDTNINRKTVSVNETGILCLGSLVYCS
jgi:hypothetical protein